MTSYDALKVECISTLLHNSMFRYLEGRGSLFLPTIFNSIQIIALERLQCYATALTMRTPMRCKQEESSLMCELRLVVSASRERFSRSRVIEVLHSTS